MESLLAGYVAHHAEEFNTAAISGYFRFLLEAGADPGFFLGVAAPLSNGVTDW